MTNVTKFLKTFSIALWTFIKSLVLVLLFVGIAGMIWGSFYLKSVLDETPELDVSRIYATESTTIYDADGDIIAELGIEKRDWVSYNDISPVLIDAFLATEDSRFFEHHGVDWYRFIAAFFTNLSTGSFDQGASTITQQLVKQSHLSADKEIERKIQEIYLAIQLEQVLTKEQIMEAYLNYSPFGGSVYGIQKAAEYYFGKTADDLTLSEAATLAGLVQSPANYRPDREPENAESRRDTVLKLMVLHGYVDQVEADLAAAQPITDLLRYKETDSPELQVYQSFIDVVLNEVEDKYKLDPYSGLQIYTTMDKEAQQLLYDIQNGNSSVNLNNLESGIVFLETDTGLVRGIGGGVAEEDERTFNNATDIERQPGSTAKPIFAYGPAIEYLGWGSGTTIEDKLYTYQSNPDTVVHNWDLMYRGPVTMRAALDRSLNVPAVTAFNAVGAEKVGDFASSLGIPVVKGEIYESLAIGGATTGYSPMEMAGAYAAFGNGGIYNEPVTIEQIVTSDGTVIESTQESNRVMSEQTAYLMTNMLHSVMTDGTGTTANVSGMYLSGKTGTTNFDSATSEKLNLPQSAIRDSWFIGYSADYTTSVWTGHNVTKDSSQIITSYTQSTPWYIFRYIMQNLNPYDATPPTKPNGIVSSAIEKESYPVKLPSSLTPGAYITNELFISGNQPTEYSTRFEQLGTPQNVTGSFDGSTLSMSWSNINNYTLPTNQINSMLSVHAANQRKSLANMSNVSVPEDELRMMLNQIKMIGSTTYKVYAKNHLGQEVNLGSTQSNKFSKPLTVGQMSSYETFYVRAAYQNHSGLSSNNSNAIRIECANCFSYVTIPNMSGWTKSQVEQFASKNNLKLVFQEVTDTSVADGTVVSSSPAFNSSVEPATTLTVNIAIHPLTVPNYMTEGDVITKYKTFAALHNMTVNTVNQASDSVPVGHLIQTQPAIGAQISKGGTLTLVISTGPASQPEPTPDGNGNNNSGPSQTLPPESGGLGNTQNPGNNGSGNSQQPGNNGSGNSQQPGNNGSENSQQPGNNGSGNSQQSGNSDSGNSQQPGNNGSENSQQPDNNGSGNPQQ